MSFVVAIADTLEKNVILKRFEARSIKECQDKIMNYIMDSDNFEWDDDVNFPDNYNEFINYIKDSDILVSDIKDIELI